MNTISEEQVLNALSCLTNGALNYYQASQTVLVRDELIRNYITNLQKQNTELKDIINKLNTNWKEFEKYLDNNKLVLNNSNILQFYLIQKDLLKGDKE